MPKARLLHRGSLFRGKERIGDRLLCRGRRDSHLFAGCTALLGAADFLTNTQVLFTMFARQGLAPIKGSFSAPPLLPFRHTQVVVSVPIHPSLRHSLTPANILFL